MRKVVFARGVRSIKPPDATSPEFSRNRKLRRGRACGILFITHVEVRPHLLARAGTCSIRRAPRTSSHPFARDLPSSLMRERWNSRERPGINPRSLLFQDFNFFAGAKILK